jgi:hypothetical protein
MRGCLATLIAASLLASGARAETARRPLSPVVAAPRFDLCEAALAAETDLDAVALSHCRARYAELVGALQATWVETGSRREAAQRLLAFLHENVLRGAYRAQASRLSSTLTRGDYNCLSATLLFAALAERLGYSVEGTLWPAHVACALSDDEQSIDIEPTCREWFLAPDAAARHELRRQALLSLGVAYSGDPPRRLNGRQLIALAHFNLGTERLHAGQSSAAVEALERARALDPVSPEIRDNLLAALNNEAAALQRQGAVAAAQERLVRCQQIAPGDRLTAENLARLRQP